MSPEEVTADDLMAVSRMRPSGVEALLRLDEWHVTRSMLIKRRLGPEAWEVVNGERYRLTREAAQMIADSLNSVRPWEGGW